MASLPFAGMFWLWRYYADGCGLPDSLILFRNRFTSSISLSDDLLVFTTMALAYCISLFTDVLSSSIAVFTITGSGKFINLFYFIQQVNPDISGRLRSSITHWYSFSCSILKADSPSKAWSTVIPWLCIISLRPGFAPCGLQPVIFV
jgi:hypothetical protein